MRKTLDVFVVANIKLSVAVLRVVWKKYFDADKNHLNVDCSLCMSLIEGGVNRAF